jgi:hypothetical protein
LRELLRISAQMKASRPLFIIGEARSGTSILYRTLQKHSSFRPIEPNLVETEICSHLRRTFMFGRAYPSSLIRFMLGDEARYRQFLRSIRTIRLLSALLVVPNLVIRDRSDLLWYGNLNHLVLRSYFFHAQKARGCLRLVEKTPTNTPNIDRFWKSFPNTRFLYIHRHPVDVFSSYRRRARDDPEAGWAAALTPEGFCLSYKASLERVLRWSHEHENLRMVRYEGFTRNPAGEFSSICEFLGAPFEPIAVEEHEADPARWRGDPLLWGEIVSATKDWRDYMTAGEADVIQKALSDQMSRLGYEDYRLS